MDEPTGEVQQPQFEQSHMIQPQLVSDGKDSLCSLEKFANDYAEYNHSLNFKSNEIKFMKRKQEEIAEILARIGDVKTIFERIDRQFQNDISLVNQYQHSCSSTRDFSRMHSISIFNSKPETNKKLLLRLQHLPAGKPWQRIRMMLSHLYCAEIPETGCKLFDLDSRQELIVDSLTLITPGIFIRECQPISNDQAFSKFRMYFFFPCF